jgi:hypothetical protein
VYVFAVHRAYNVWFAVIETVVVEVIVKPLPLAVEFQPSNVYPVRASGVGKLP